MTRPTRLWLLAIAVPVVVAVVVFGMPRGAPAPSSPQPTLLDRASPDRTSQPAGSTRTPGASEGAASGRPPSGAVAVLVGAGDISECDNDRDAATADLVEDVEGTVFVLGDNAYEDGSVRNYASCYGPTWGRPSIKDRTRPVVGNHEYHTPGAAAYFGYFGAAAGNPEEGWYAYDAGAWRVYVLNSNCGEIGGCRAGSAQEQWLREDLAANPSDCVLAMAHHPRFSSGEHGNNEVMTDMWQALQDAGAELMLTGHDHSYERFAPQDASGKADPDGIIEIVVGTGGRDAYEFKDEKPNSLVRATPVFGVLRLDLRPDGYEFRFLAAPGTDFTDTGSGACH